MAFILNIDTATSICSVALARDGEMIGIKENTEGLNHSLLLGTYIDELLKENGKHPQELDAIAVSMGPGSYTGLRIGISMAKGLCFGISKPLIAVDTLQALALSVSQTIKEDAYYCPMIDARRMEVYTALYDNRNHPLTPTQAKIINETSFREILKEHKVYFFGNGSGKVQSLLSSANACFLKNIETSARHLTGIAEQKFFRKEFENTAYFEPFYLKDFIATTPRHKVI